MDTRDKKRRVSISREEHAIYSRLVLLCDPRGCVGYKRLRQCTAEADVCAGKHWQLLGVGLCHQKYSHLAGHPLPKMHGKWGQSSENRS